MYWIATVNDKINNKIHEIEKLSEHLNEKSYSQLNKTLWELEREAALLREYIERNVDEDDLEDYS